MAIYRPDEWLHFAHARVILEPRYSLKKAMIMPQVVTDYSEQLQQALAGNVEAPAMSWIDSAIDSLKQAEDVIAELGLMSAMARRKMGRHPSDELLSGPLPVLDVTPEIEPISLTYWSTGDAARAVLYLEAAKLAPDIIEAMMTDVFRMGDEFERAAIVRSLSLLPLPESLKPLALEASRINSLNLYTALSLNNPYPALYFTEPEFNQLVLKSLFNMLDMTLILGLQNRANHDLSRMCESYVQERRDAGREVPQDIWLPLAPFADDTGVAYIREYLRHDNAEHRKFCLLAIPMLPEPFQSDLLQEVRELLGQEPVKEVRTLMENIAG